MGVTEAKQLTLGLSLNDEATFNNFCGSDNAVLLASLQRAITADGEQFIYLWGPPSIGRSHLLQACCHQVGEAGKPVMYIPLKEFKQAKPSILENMENLALVAIDDIHCIAGQHDWQVALYQFFNMMREQGSLLVIAGNTSPTTLSIELADLKSRLAWGSSFQVQVLTDSEKIKALQLRAKQRGFKLSDEVGQLLISRCSRDMRQLFNILERLDEASMVAKRKLTVPFVKSVLRI